MFIPIGDSPNPPRFVPWVNWSLIAANVGVYLLFTLPLSVRPVDPGDPMLAEYLRVVSGQLPYGVGLRELLASLSVYDLFVFAHGYKSAAPEVTDLFAALFLHGGFLHLAGNMLFLWIFGDNVEHRLGRLGYLLVYLLTGVAATLTFAAVSAPSWTPLVGASGAISGVLGLYFLLFERNRVKVFVALFPFFFDVILLPARWVLGFYVLIDNLLPFLLGSGSSVAYGAHLGGFFAGLGVAYLGERLSWRWPWKDPYWRAGTTWSGLRVVGAADRPATGVQAVREAIGHNRLAQAISALGELSADEVAQLRPAECVVLAGWLDQAGHGIAAGNILRRCLGSHTSARDLAQVYLALGRMRLRQGQPTAAYQYLLAVFDYEPDPATAAQAREALAQIEVHRRMRP